MSQGPEALRSLVGEPANPLDIRTMLADGDIAAVHLWGGTGYRQPTPIWRKRL